MSISDGTSPVLGSMEDIACSVSYQERVGHIAAQSDNRKETKSKGATRCCPQLSSYTALPAAYV